MNAQGDQWGASGSVNAQRARRGCGCIPANAYTSANTLAAGWQHMCICIYVCICMHMHMDAYVRL